MGGVNCKDPFHSLRNGTYAAFAVHPHTIAKKLKPGKLSVSHPAYDLTEASEYDKKL